MTQTTVETVEGALSALLYNAGLQAYTAGRFDEAIDAFAEAARLQPGQPQYAAVACKASFACGRFEEARSYLLLAQVAELDKSLISRMSRAIDRAIAVEQSSLVPVRCEPGPPDPSNESWTLVFCDWLESIVHEICQDLRQSAAGKDARE